MSEPTKAEQVFYERDGVRVTSARFQVGAQTYAMSAVNSVSYQRVEAGQGFAIFLGLSGAFLLVLAGFSFFFTMAQVVAVGLGVMGALLLGVGGYLAKSARPTFTVALTTASGQVSALSSHDPASVEPVVRALNEAMVSRG